MKVVIAIDSFKGSLSSLEAGSAAKSGINKVFPKSKIEVFSIADGGEGTLEALHNTKGTKKISVKVKNPLGLKIQSEYLLLDKNTAAIEMAKASGLTLISGDQRNPLKTSSYGTGELIKHALKKGVKNFIVGIGGSATNDGGLGMLAALGWKFFDKKEIELKEFGGENLIRINRIDSSSVMKELSQAEFTILCDVENPFCGKDGAAYVFAPQKGASAEDVKFLDKGLSSFANAIKKYLQKDIKNLKGSGAAGGLGGAFMAFMNARFKNGINGVLDAVNFDEALKDADYVITGEGKLDSQTAMGKAPWGVAMRAKKYKIPTIAIGGGIAKGAENLYANNIAAMFASSTGPLSLDDAMKKENAARNVEHICENIFRVIKTIKKI